MGTTRRQGGNSMAARAGRAYERNVYIDGNTVRRMEAAPDYREEKRRQERIREYHREKEQEALRAERERAARRNSAKALKLSKGYVTFLTACAMIIAMSSVGYIKLQSNITSHMKAISSLESELEDIKTDNAATKKRINTATDLNHIKDVAINQLGMVYAGENQIVYYSVDNDDYMNQYEDIPSN